MNYFPFQNGQMTVQNQNVVPVQGQADNSNIQQPRIQDNLELLYQLTQLQQNNFYNMPTSPQFQMNTMGVLSQQIDKCLICGRPILNYPKIPLAFDKSQGRDVFACSFQCEGKWKNLIQQQLYQQQLLQARPTMGLNSAIRKPVPPPIRPVPQGIVPTSQKKQSPASRLEKPPSPPRKQENLSKKSRQSWSSKVENKVSKQNTHQQQQEKQQQQQQQQQQLEPIFVVVDTNCLLEHLLQVLNLKHHKHVTLVIPQIVIHELDGLKKDEEVGFQARTAMRFIHEALQENQGNVKKWLRGQTANEVLPGDQTALTNDDKILNCALFYNKYIAPDHTILITNDKALTVKVMMNGIRGYNFDDFLAQLPPVYKTNESTSYEQVKGAEPSPYVEKKNELTTIVYEESSLCFIQPSIWKKIFSFLTPRELATVAMVNHSFYRLSNEDDVWKNCIRNTFEDHEDVLVPKNIPAKQWYLKWREDVLTCRV